MYWNSTNFAKQQKQKIFKSCDTAWTIINFDIRHIWGEYAIDFMYFTIYCQFSLYSRSERQNWGKPPMLLSIDVIIFSMFSIMLCEDQTLTHIKVSQALRLAL